MARFYPAFVGDFHGSEGERLAYHALEMLGDDYTVFHSYCWLGDGVRTAAQGEADFLVLHPRHGILAIEVKAGGIAYENGAWQQTNRNTGETHVIFPFQQAERSRQRVLAEMQKRMQQNVPLVGKAVWFTSVQIPQGKPLPLESPRDIILDADDLRAPKERLERIYAYWRGILHIPERTQSPAEFQQTIRVLQPVFRIVETLASVSAAVEQSTARLTNAQFALLEYLCDQRTAAIHGAAGTGKSLLAVEKARMLAREGQKVLYLCFNEFLLERLRSCCWDRNITIHNERTLAEELMTGRELRIETVLREFEEFFQNEYDGTEWAYPNIIVDEAQDFPSALLEQFAMLAELYDGAFYLFYDRGQTILSRRVEGQVLQMAPAWIDAHMDCRLVLYRNCRNTAEIGRTVGSFIERRHKNYLSDVHGKRPCAVFVSQTEALAQAAADFVRRMRSAERLELRDIVILTVSTLVKSVLGSLTELAGIPVSHKPEEGKLWLTTVRRYKGLEAKAVLLVDVRVSRLTDSTCQRLIYVGSSRATAYLETLFLNDVAKEEYPALTAQLGDDIASTPQGIAGWLGMECRADG